MMQSTDAASFQSRRLSTLPAIERSQLIETYRRDVYEPAFPDESIREDPQYWLDLMAAEPYPPPPQPRIEVVLLLEGDRVVAGVTVEHYRDADCGLLTYISVAPALRGRGLGRKLVEAARAALDAMSSPATPLFAETERLEDAHNAEETAETVLRQKRLDSLGARLIDFDYIMPPLRPDSEPHRLHLLLIDPDRRWRSLEPSRVVALMRELAAALGADLAAHDDTTAMMDALHRTGPLALRSLPAAQISSR